MPSFSCDGCGDVIKKPKLDSHSMRCRSSVTCLDCSTTFTNPASWKSHTSCISEAQKYQKSLYKPPKANNKSNGVHQSSIKNNPPPVPSVTSIIPPSTHSKLDLRAANDERNITTEPKGRSHDGLSAFLDQDNQKDKPKKKEMKRNGQNQEEEEEEEVETEDEKINNLNHQSKKQDSVRTGVVCEEKRHKKKSKKTKEDSEPREGNPTILIKKKRKKDEFKVETIQKEQETESLEQIERQSENKKSKKEKKRRKKEAPIGTMTDDNGIVDQVEKSQEPMRPNETTILRHSKEIIIAANGQPIKLKDLITSNLKFILDINNDNDLALSVTTNKPLYIPQDDNNKLQSQDEIKSKIQQIFEDNLQFIAQKTDANDGQTVISLSWSGKPF